MKYLMKTALVSALAAFALPAMALTASQSVQKEIVTIAADGSETVTYAPAELVTPGERVVYSLNYENDKTEPATNLVLTMPIPGEVILAEGTARGQGTVVSYSVDGEKFADRESLSVSLDNGATRPAASEDITHIRWDIAGPVEPGQAGTLAFTGVLK